MKVGFTGSRNGPTAYQAWEFLKVISRLEMDEFHHGDCIGADAHAHEIIQRQYQNCKIVVHPPSNDSLRAFCQGDECRKPKDYIPRNHAIVNETDLLIAMPEQKTEVLRSGTWSTVRYARKHNKSVIMIYSDGTVEDSVITEPKEGQNV